MLIEKRRWLSEQDFASGFALAQTDPHHPPEAAGSAEPATPEATPPTMPMMSMMPMMPMMQNCMGMMEMMQNQIARLKLAAYSPDVTVEIPRNACRYFEFWRAQELIALGHERIMRAFEKSGK